MNQFTNAIRNKVSDAWILWFLNRHEQNHDNRLERAHRATQQRLAEHRQIAEFAEPHNGQYVYGHEDYTGPIVAVITWSRDCDHVCGESRSFIPATLNAYDAFRESQLEWADGPMSFNLARPSDRFQSWSRDMVLEAYEDGHPHSVTDAYEPPHPVSYANPLPDSPEHCEYGDDEYQWRLHQAGL